MNDTLMVLFTAGIFLVALINLMVILADKIKK
ncbi:putative holin-like toxin [Metabacillus fastidiosus]